MNPVRLEQFSFNRSLRENSKQLASGLKIFLYSDPQVTKQNLRKLKH